MADLVIRPYEDDDEPVVLQLLGASLGKDVDDRYRRFFRWKHLQNPFGRSFMWVGVLDGVIVGFRSFLRWRFVDPSGEAIEAVRAVDTATHPNSKGLGVFRTLTLHGLDEMRPRGVQFVFNTPNDQSRPGYLKMGWRVERRTPVRVRPRAPWSLLTILRARTAADPWSLGTSVGGSLSDHSSIIDSCGPRRVRGELVTARCGAFMRWRYEQCPDVASVAIAAGGGAVILRLRRRGPAVECAVGDTVGDLSSLDAGRAVRLALRRSRADFALATAHTSVSGLVEAPGLGPVQTRRDVSPSAAQLPLALTLGDVELF